LPLHCAVLHFLWALSYWLLTRHWFRKWQCSVSIHLVIHLFFLLIGVFSPILTRCHVIASTYLHQNMDKSINKAYMIATVKTAKEISHVGVLPLSLLRRPGYIVSERS
jgi:uncharacterized membrane protein